MNRTRFEIVVRAAAAVASIATTLGLLSAVASLSEPHRSQLIAATASRQMATQQVVLLAQSKHAQPTPVADVTAR